MVFFPTLVFWGINNVHGGDTTLDLDASVQTLAFQIPTVGDKGFKVLYNIQNSVKNDLKGEVTDYQSATDDLVVILGETELKDLSSDISTFADKGAAADARVSTNAQTRESCGDSRFDASGNPMQGAVFGSLGLPVLKGQRGVGIPGANAKVHDQTTRNLNAIAACHKIDLALEFTEDAAQVALSKKDAGATTHGADDFDKLIKDGYKLDGYLADYNPFAMDVRDTIGVRCIALSKIDSKKSGTCSIFLNNATKAENLADAIDNADHVAAFSDATELTNAKLKGIKNQARNCPIICDAQGEDDYFEDRKHGAFGAHVRAARSENVKKCIAGIHEAARQTLDTEDITVRQTLTAITRDQATADKLDNTIGFTSSVFTGGCVLMLLLPVWFFAFSYYFANSGNQVYVNIGKTIAQLVVLTTMILFAYTAEHLHVFKGDSIRSAVSVPDALDDCPVTSSSAEHVSHVLIDWSTASAILPGLFLLPVIGLMFLWIPYGIVYGICKMASSTIEFCEYFNLGLHWNQGYARMPYALSLVNGQASDADADEIVPAFTRKISLNPSNAGKIVA